MYEKILEALRRNATGEALALAHAAIAANPADPQAYHWLAAAQQQSGDTRAALSSIDQAISLAPEQAALHTARATLLFGINQRESAGAALARASSLNPNEIDAYVMQAQIALGLGDLEEAARLSRLAARVDPDHPQLAAVDGMLALRRGEHDLAQRIVMSALKRLPDDAQLNYALAFIYMEQGHWAFAEQVLRKLMDTLPASTLLPLLADLLQRQGRPAEAADELMQLLDDPQVATPAMFGLVGRLRMDADQSDQALPLLLKSISQIPVDRASLQALINLGRIPGYREQVTMGFEAALATAPDSLELWKARVLIQPFDGSAGELFQRWVAHMPDSLVALNSQLEHHRRMGEVEVANALADKIMEIDPDNAQAQAHFIGELLAGEPAAAIKKIEAWIVEAGDVKRQRRLLHWLGLVQDKCGLFGEATATWMRLHAGYDQERGLPPVSAARDQWPEPVALPVAGKAAMFLWGVPGSGVEAVAAVLAAAPAFRDDRFGPAPPSDILQDYSVIQGLADGQVSGAALVGGWRGALPARAIKDEQIIDWLPWWDNAFLLGLRPYLSEASLLIVLRDPRDTLLSWLAFGSPAPYAMPAPHRAAGWLAFVLGNTASLIENNWYPHRLVRMDDAGYGPEAAAKEVSRVLQSQWPVPASIGSVGFPPGHWRQYAHVLAEPFALLTPVAVRLGYPEN